MDKEYAPIPSLLALTAVHNHLVRERTRTQVALIIESGEPREVMHFALLIGYGASAVNPYLAIETLEDMAQRGRLGNVTFETALKNFKKAINKGLLKVFSKMGISTLQSYRGAQVFEAIGLNKELIDKYFTGTASRIEGVGLDVLAREAQMKHEHAFRPVTESETELDVGRRVSISRASGEYHLLNPLTVSKLQHAVRRERFETFQEYADLIDKQNRDLCTLRGLMELKLAKKPVPHRGSRAGERNRQALRHRRDVVRLDQQGSARDAGHRHEPHRRALQYRRRRRGRSALRARRQRRLARAAPSSRWPRGASA